MCRHTIVKNPFGDSGVLSALWTKLYTQFVRDFSQLVRHAAREESVVARAGSKTNLPGTTEALVPLMTNQKSKEILAVDIVIPVHSERPEALEATLSACLKQT